VHREIPRLAARPRRAGAGLRVLYGGSVNTKNAAALLAER